MELHAIKPYDDENLRFDERTKRYVLTLEFAKRNLPSTYRDDTVLLKRLDLNSRKIYDFIHYRGCSANRPVVDALLNRTQEGRGFLLELLAVQMEADAQSGFNDLSQAPAINLANGSVIDRDQLRANQISVDAEQIVDDSSAHFGVTITLRQRYPWNLFLWQRGLE